MTSYIIKRILLIFPTLFGISIITFIIIKMAPGDPTAFKMGSQEQGLSADQNMAKAVVEQTREIYGLDKPLMLNFRVFTYQSDWEDLQAFLASHPGIESSDPAYDEELTLLKQADETAVAFLMDQVENSDLSDLELRAAIEVLTLKQKLPIDPSMDMATQLGYINTWWHGKRDSSGSLKPGEADQYQFSTWQKLKMVFTEAQYPRWLVRMMIFDFGNSIKDNRPILDHLKEKLPVTLIFTIASFFISYLIAIPLGIYSATHQYSLLDKTTTVALFVLYSLPNFWVATMAIVYFGGGDFLDWFPVAGLNSVGYEDMRFFDKTKDLLSHIILPLSVWTYSSFTQLSRFMRGSMLEVIRQDYIRTARAKGLSERVVVYKHALRNSLIPIITIFANILPYAISGSIIIEFIFSIPGMGQWAYQSILFRDYPAIMAIFTLTAIMTLIGILLADILYALVDPRISFDSKPA
ncbi:MAG: hypothetical protein B6244_00110 [Candidatus Cloacimonetes bacterium 4572_55]|nr:MAG: hypothetical protein B6244_00110 [Candidatus Cloacimonetes bacterium 4572_55]